MHLYLLVLGFPPVQRMGAQSFIVALTNLNTYSPRV